MSENRPSETDKKNIQYAPCDYQDMMMNTPIGIFTSTPEGRFIDVNPAMALMFGYDSPREMMNSVKDVAAELYADPGNRNEIRSFLERHDERLNYECRFVRRNGSTFWASNNVRAVRDEKGNIVYYQSFFTDITARKKSEEVLRDTETRYRLLFEYSPYGVVMIDPATACLLEFNETAHRQLGYSREEFAGLSVSDIEVDETPEETRSHIANVMERGRHDFETRHKTRQGEILNVHVTAQFVKIAGKQYFHSIWRDITERKRSEKALRESEERLRLLSDVTMEGIVIHKHGIVLDLNFSITKMIGYQRDELLGNNIIELAVHKDDRDIVSENIVKEHAQPYIVRCVRKNGEVFFAELEARNFENQGEIFRVVAIRDITERKRTESALRESEEKFRILADSTPTAVMLYQDDRYIYANKAAEMITGYSVNELLGMNFWEFMTPDFRETARERGRKRQKAEQTISNYELKMVRKDGNERWGYLSGSTTKIGGRPAGIISVVDITDRKRAEEALRESELKYRFLTESMTDVVWTTDLNFKITYVSPSIEKVLGFTPEERMLQNVEDTMTKESYDVAVNLLARELETERSEKMDPDRFTLVPTEYYHKGGHTVWMESMVRFIRGREGNPVGIHGVSRDITERKRAEEEKEKLKEQLSHSRKMESIGTLAGGIAHDFNNLLMGIQGNASLMMLELDPSDPHHERLQQIEEQVKSGADLTKQLMGFARGRRYEMKPTDMNEIVEKTATMFGRTKKELTIYRKQGTDLWAVEADRTQMGQVFMNLFVNAWQAMPWGGKIFLQTENVFPDEAKATGFALSPGKYVRVTVSDTGTGMDAKTLEQIFDPFFTTKGMGRGTGLGLATVYGIIKGHGGVIHVTSRLGEGTTFEIYLPATEKAVVGEKETQTAALRGTETILLVDDEAVVLEVTGNMLQSLGYRVLCAGSGREAMDVYCEKRNEIDLVILDMIMPGISGNETFDCLRKIDPTKKVLLSSGYSIEGMARELLEKGCDGFIQKPFRMEDLAREVRAVLHAKKVMKT